MTNVLPHEWVEILDAAAATHGAVGGASGKHDAWWESYNRGVVLHLRLDPSHSERGCLVPRLHVTGGASHCSDPAVLLADLDSRRDAALRSARAYGDVAHLRIWIESAPCDRCIGRGTDGGGNVQCRWCDGKGSRTAQEMIDEEGGRR